jgi:hypothetical protein
LEALVHLLCNAIRAHPFDLLDLIRSQKMLRFIMVTTIGAVNVFRVLSYSVGEHLEISIALRTLESDIPCTIGRQWDAQHNGFT